MNKPTNKYRLHIIVVVMITLGVFIMAHAIPAQADGRPKAAQLKVLGKTMGQWSARWWQWALSIPADSNPILEGDCNQNQRGSVWFLAGNAGGVSSRECTVPKGKFIFFPLVNAVFPNFPGEDFSVEEKRIALDEFIGSACNLSATVDGIPVVFDNPFIRTQSPTFPVMFIEDNIYELPTGWIDTETVADGFWIMLPPLSKGEHMIHFTGAVCEEGEPFFEVDVTYLITVSPGKHHH